MIALITNLSIKKIILNLLHMIKLTIFAIQISKGKITNTLGIYKATPYNVNPKRIALIVLILMGFVDGTQKLRLASLLITLSKIRK